MVEDRNHSQSLKPTVVEGYSVIRMVGNRAWYSLIFLVWLFIFKVIEKYTSKLFLSLRIITYPQTS